MEGGSRLEQGTVTAGYGGLRRAPLRPSASVSVSGVLSEIKAQCSRAHAQHYRRFHVDVYFSLLLLVWATNPSFFVDAMCGFGRLMFRATKN